jgi:hypothetical protein
MRLNLHANGACASTFNWSLLNVGFVPLIWGD